jgi:hypothetical protein
MSSWHQFLAKIKTYLRPAGDKSMAGTSPAMTPERWFNMTGTCSKSGAAVAAAAATKQPDGTFTAARIDVGRGGVVP